MKSQNGHTSGSTLFDYLDSDEMLAPERELASRMITQALCDAAGVQQVALSVPGSYSGAKAAAYLQQCVERIRHEALEFIFDEYDLESAPPYSFVWLCDVVNLSVAHIRSFVSSADFADRMQAHKEGQKNRYRSGRGMQGKRVIDGAGDDSRAHG